MPSPIAVICPREPGIKSAIIAAATPMSMRLRSGVSVRAMPHTAYATTATATACRPTSTPAPMVPVKSAAPDATSNIRAADGRVNAAHAASAPRYPARPRPIANPTWLDAGPGKNWHSATSSAYWRSLNQPRLATNSSRK